MPKIISASPFHKKIHTWYFRTRRKFPWRKTRLPARQTAVGLAGQAGNPYRILLSEIMAQQTQVSRVVEYYKRWLKKFPTFSALANASAADVLREWSGLGYNSRALRFHQLAKIVSTEFHSRLPQRPDELQQLPGIGQYTAHAVACFAFGKNIPVVDVNIKRILTRWTKKIRSASEQMKEHEAWNTAKQFLPTKHAYEWNQSLMDFGAAICTARNPKCNVCPVASLCLSACSKVFLQKEKKKNKSEPSWKGIPRRLYRGKILKLLHHHSFSADEIAVLLWGTRLQRDIVWTESVLNKMTRDGLLSTRNGKYFIVQ